MKCKAGTGYQSTSTSADVYNVPSCVHRHGVPRTGHALLNHPVRAGYRTTLQVNSVTPSPLCLATIRLLPTSSLSIDMHNQSRQRLGFTTEKAAERTLEVDVQEPGYIGWT